MEFSFRNRILTKTHPFEQYMIDKSVHNFEIGSAFISNINFDLFTLDGWMDGS